MGRLRGFRRPQPFLRGLIVLVPLVVLVCVVIIVMMVASGSHRNDGGVQPCTLGAKCEAEEASLYGTRTEAPGPGQWAGASGGGFVVGFEHPGTSIAWAVADVPASGSHDLDIRYSNYRGQDDHLGTRTLTLTVNRDTKQIQLPTTQGWRAWSDFLVSGVELAEGGNTMKLEFADHDTGRVNIDFIRIY